MLTKTVHLVVAGTEQIQLNECQIGANNRKSLQQSYMKRLPIVNDNGCQLNQINVNPLNAKNLKTNPK